MSDITFDDIARYMGGGGATKQQQQHIGLRPYEAEKDNDGFRQPKRYLAEQAAPLPLGVKAKDKEEEVSPPTAGIGGPPIVRTQDGRVRIPFDVYAAVETLVSAQADGDLQLSRDFVAQLGDVLRRCKHEYVMIDPPVLISDSFKLGANSAIVVYVEEVVPVSILLLALALGCSYGLPGNYSVRFYNQMRVAPFEGILVKGSQSFHLRDQVERELRERGLDTQDVRVMMMRAGELSSRDACDGVWQDQLIEQIGKQILK